MPLKGEISFPAKNGHYHGGHYMIITWKHENLASIVFTLDE